MQQPGMVIPDSEQRTFVPKDSRFSFLPVLLTVVLLLRAFTASADENWNMPAHLGEDLRDALPQKFQRTFRSLSVTVEKNPVPFVRSVASVQGRGQAPSVVVVSSGFLDLLNRLARAKAVDRTQPGSFRQYVATMNPSPSEAVARDASDVTAWKFSSIEVINGADGYFNQMLAAAVAIEMAHHYLGHEKERIAGGMMPATSSLSTAEWERTIRAATEDFLNCGFAVEGLQVIFEAVEQMTSRPAWAGHFVCDGANTARMKKELTQMEQDYFRGK